MKVCMLLSSVLLKEAIGEENSELWSSLEVTADFIRWGVGGGGGICETVHYVISDVTVVSKAVDIMNEIKDVSSSKPLQHYIVLIWSGWVDLRHFFFVV